MRMLQDLLESILLHVTCYKLHEKNMSTLVIQPIDTHHTSDLVNLLNYDDLAEDEKIEACTEYIQSLKQPKTPKWFVAETKYDTLMDNNSWWEGNLIVRLKTATINDKTYLVGTYE